MTDEQARRLGDYALTERERYERRGDEDRPQHPAIVPVWLRRQQENGARDLTGQIKETN